MTLNLPLSTQTAQLVFTKTRILSVKIATLATFLAMVKTLGGSTFPSR
jgi:hypothetical protein